MTTPEDYPGTGDLPDRARVWIDLHDRDDVPTAATLADGHDVTTYRDSRVTTGFRALEFGADTYREVLADGSGLVFEDGRATTCPDCIGDLQSQNRQSILCLGCEQDYEHWKNASSYHLVDDEPITGSSGIVESRPREIRTDGGHEVLTDAIEHSRELVTDRRIENCIDSYTVDLSLCYVLGWVNVWLIANPRTVGNMTPERNKLIGGAVDSPVSPPKLQRTDYRFQTPTT